MQGSRDVAETPAIPVDYLNLPDRPPLTSEPRVPGDALQEEAVIVNQANHRQGHLSVLRE